MDTTAPAPHSRRLLVAAFVALLLAGVVGTLPMFARPAAAVSSDEADYLVRINALRASVGAPPLELDENLNQLSLAQTQRMAAASQLFHTPDLTAGVTSEWTNLGENVGVGSNNQVVFDAFVKSPHHYENLVNPAFTHVGIAVIQAGPIQWTTHRFMTKASPVVVAPTPPPAPVVEEPAPAPAPVVIPAPAPQPAPVPAPAPRPVLPAPTTTIPVVPVVPAAPVVTTPPAPAPVPEPVATPADPDRVDAMVVALHTF